MNDHFYLQIGCYLYGILHVACLTGTWPILCIMANLIWTVCIELSFNFLFRLIPFNLSNPKAITYIFRVTSVWVFIPLMHVYVNTNSRASNITFYPLRYIREPFTYIADCYKIRFEFHIKYGFNELLNAFQCCSVEILCGDSLFYCFF